MKLLTLSLLLAAAPCAAEQVAKTGNNAGGEIVLTDTQAQCPDGWYSAFTRAPTGETVFGCWIPVGNYVAVMWPGKTDAYTYSLADFTLLNYGRTK